MVTILYIYHFINQILHTNMQIQMLKHCCMCYLSSESLYLNNTSRSRTDFTPSMTMIISKFVERHNAVFRYMNSRARISAPPLIDVTLSHLSFVYLHFLDYKKGNDSMAIELLWGVSELIHLNHFEEGHIVFYNCQVPLFHLTFSKPY